MRDIWLSLPSGAQDALILALFLVPALAIGVALLRGVAPFPLVSAILWRFRWANTMFVALIAISVGMGIGLVAQERGLRAGTAQAADKFDLVVTAPGSELTMLFATVFLQPQDVPLLGGAAFERVASHENVEIAAPLAFGDSYRSAPVVGTIESFARHLSDNRIEGRMWRSSGEAIAGALSELEIGAVFTPAHGHGSALEEGAHAGTEIEVVGRMAPTGTPWDRSILVPVETVWETHGLANGHAPSDAGRIGPPFDPDHFPGTPAIVVRADELWANYALRSEFTRDGETMAFFPGTVLSNLYIVMGDVRQAMSIMALVTQGLVAASVLLGLFILSRLFRRQIALLRALGASSRFVLAVMWSYGTALLATGATLGLGVGYAATAILSRIVTERTDIVVSASLGWSEFHLVAGFLSVTTILSLLPVLAQRRQSVVGGLRA
ncbi:FtsX-like permease family protein [Roseivivax sediminis]|uniref:Putative ABC transport system permease protein n=1 Tax=Roseivivax sediminis TaxID=936889 RepID=A0A1I2CPN2_9RHOB|nr:FtsX-like permease family protein [Roseivivax sediminis]SFE70208.1 putative ABC transport system permease protein [Roseivivax sediminis]